MYENCTMEGDTLNRSFSWLFSHNTQRHGVGTIFRWVRRLLDIPCATPSTSWPAHFSPLSSVVSLKTSPHISGTPNLYKAIPDDSSSRLSLTRRAISTFLRFLANFVSSRFVGSSRTFIPALVTIAANNFAVPLINSEAQPWDLPSVAELGSCA